MPGRLAKPLSCQTSRRKRQHGETPNATSEMTGFRNLCNWLSTLSMVLNYRLWSWHRDTSSRKTAMQNWLPGLAAGFTLEGFSHVWPSGPDALHCWDGSQAFSSSTHGRRWWVCQWPPNGGSFLPMRPGPDIAGIPDIPHVWDTPCLQHKFWTGSATGSAPRPSGAVLAVVAPQGRNCCRLFFFF